MRKILFFIRTQAEQSLLYLVMHELQSNNAREICVLTCTKSDFFSVSVKNSEVNSTNEPAAIASCQKMGQIMEKVAIVLQDLTPDLIVLEGNGQEEFCCASVATIFNIPIAHIHADIESTTTVDVSFKHSITKMSHIHVAMCKTQEKRILQLGENPALVLTKETFEEENLVHIMHGAQVKNIQIYDNNVSFIQSISRVLSTVQLDGLIKKKFFDMVNRA